MARRFGRGRRLCGGGKSEQDFVLLKERFGVGEESLLTLPFGISVLAGLFAWLFLRRDSRPNLRRLELLSVLLLLSLDIPLS
jgi:hypothetical protein